MLTSFLPLIGVLLFAIAIVVLSGRSGLSLAQRLRILSMTMRLDSGELNPGASTLPTSAELRTRCTELAAKLLDQRGLAPDKRDDKWEVSLRETAAALHDYSALEETATRNERQAFEQAMWDTAVAEQAARDANPNSRGSRGPGAAFDNLDQAPPSAGQFLVESDAYRNAVAEGRQLPETEVRNLLTGGSIGTSGSHLFAPVGSPYLNQAAVRRLRLFVRDLIPVQGTGLSSVPYIRELNALTNETGAGMVKEASAKPEVTMQFESADAPVRKIAAWLQVTDEAYNDAPTLAGYVDTRLAYMLMVKEEQQILSGTGTNPELTGILTTSGIQTQAAIAEDLAATIGMACAKIENVDGFADGVAINPVTYWTGVVERHANQMDGGEGDAGLPFRDIPATIWGNPVVRTRSLAVNKAVVGCWQIGATIFEREGTTIRTTDSHASLFISNTRVVLAEKRTALAVHRPDFFVDTTLSFS